MKLPIWYLYGIMLAMPKIEQKTIEKLGKTIAKLRKDLDLTQEELAAKIDSSRLYINHIEQGRKSPSLEVIEKLARALKVQVKDLFS
jgi:transcriptional regulator with XRE-family HTH domain